MTSTEPLINNSLEGSLKQFKEFRGDKTHVTKILEESVAQSQEPEYSKITTEAKLYFGFSGILSLYSSFLMIAQGDIMKKLYPSYNYGFYIIIPTYISIPLSLIVQRLLRSCGMTFKHLLAVFSMMTFMTSIPLVIIFMENTLITFMTILALFTLGYMFNIVYLAFNLAILSNFNPKFSKVYFSYQALSNVTILILKTLLFSINSPIYLDVKFFLIKISSV